MFNFLIQYGKQNPKKVIILLVIILILLFKLAGVGKAKSVTHKSAADNVVLLNHSDIVKVTHGDFANEIAFTGDLSPLNQAVISSEVDAQVVKVLVSEGQYVDKDQVLAILDDSDLKQAVSEGQAQLDSAIATFKLNKTKVEREKELFEEGFISKFAYAELKTNYQSSLQQINQNKAALERAKKQLSDTTIKAPFAGYIYQKSVDNGQLTSKNGKLFALASLDKMQIKAAIPSEQINAISVGQSVDFKVETNAKVYQGTITRINPVAEIGTRSYLVYIDFDNTKYQLKAGQFVKGQIVVSHLANVDYIPTNAVRNSDTGQYVFLLVANKVVLKPVTILLSNTITGFSAVSGLKTGDTILSGNVMSVTAGDIVKVVD